MLTTVQSQLQRIRTTLRRWSLDPTIHRWLRLAALTGSGFLLSAASLAQVPQPFSLGLICSLTGFSALAASLGATAGYLVFWGSAGLGGVIWSLLGLLPALTLGHSGIASRRPWLMAALASLCAALTGLWLQSKGMAPVPLIYLLQLLLAFGTARLFTLSFQRRDTITDWLVLALGVLALCQVVPWRWLCLGFAGAAAVSVCCAFPAAALAGLALDLAEVTPVPMTAVLCLAWLTNLLPMRLKKHRALMPALIYPIVMLLTKRMDLYPLPALALGGFAGSLISLPAPRVQRRGETGVAQVRLEMTAEVYRQMQQLLLELREIPIDQQALLLKACEKACGSCSFRRSCAGREQAKSLSTHILELPITDSSLPFSCRRTGRLLQEFRRSQEQLRLLRAMHRQREESRQALAQQYRFLSGHLQSLSDGLCRSAKQLSLNYEPEIAVSGNRSERDSGDRCLRFAGNASRYYITLLDGMGTGIGAADEAQQAGALLKGLLRSGFPAEHALESLNSLCALRGRAGAVTVDLVELELDTGRASLYQWGAPPAWLVKSTGCEKIGTAGPPPGLFVADSSEAALRLSLRKGEILLLLSDGVSGEDALCALSSQESLEEQANRILSAGRGEGRDDATVALIRLRPLRA